MKIVFFDSVSDRYGSSRIGRSIINILSKAGFNVIAYVGVEHLDANDRYASTIDLPLLVMSLLKKSPIVYTCSIIFALFKLSRVFDRIVEKKSIVYCNTISTLPIAFLARFKDRRVVIHLHETTNSSLMKYIGSKILPFVATRIICVSNVVSQSWGIQAHSQVCVVHNGIYDLPTLEAENLNIIRKYDICFVGRLMEKKGINLFIDAINILDSKLIKVNNNKITVAIAGGVIPGAGDSSTYLDRVCAKNINVLYLGEVDNTSQIFSESKVVCVPSLFKDPFPTVVLEGLRSGCCIVSTSFGGASEAMSECHGELFDEADPELLADILLRNFNKWSNVVLEENRAIFLNNFTHECFSKRMIDLKFDQF